MQHKNDNFIENSYDNKTEITWRVSSTKDREINCTQEKLENEIIDAKKWHHQKYQKSKVQKNNSNKNTDNISYTDTDTDNIAFPTKSILHKWPKDTVLIIGDSMISEIDEKRLSSQQNVKMRSFPGASIVDMYNYLKLLLKKVPGTAILHVGTHNCVNESSNKVLNKILSLKQCI